MSSNKNSSFLVSRRSVLVGAAGAMATAMVGRTAMAQGAPITIAVGSDPVFTPYFVAAQEKLFAAQGLNVIVKPFTDGSTALDALISRQAQLACASEPTHLVRKARADLKALAVTQEGPTYVKLVGRKGITIEQIKKIGVVPGSVSEYVTNLLIKKRGLDLNKLQVVKSGPPEMPALLARGDIDAFFVWEPWPTMGLRQGAEVLTTSDEVGYKSNLWLTTLGPWLDTNQAAAQSILQALKKGAEVARSDPKRAAAAIQAVIKMPPATSMPLLAELQQTVRDFSEGDARTVVGISDFLMQNKAIAAPVDPKSILQTGFFKG